MRKPYTAFVDTLKRVNGVSIPVFGIQWQPKETEREAARRVIAFCEDRRILFAPHNWEMKSECIDSATATREFLTTELGKLDRQSEFAQRLEEMRRACRNFMDSLRQRETANRPRWSEQMATGAAREALDKLRECFGQQLFWIVMAHGLDVEDEVARSFPAYLTGK